MKEVFENIKGVFTVGSTKDPQFTVKANNSDVVLEDVIYHK